MNRKLVVVVLALGSLAGVYFSAVWLFESLLMPPAVSARADPEHLRLGEAFLDDLDAGRYEEALARTTPQVREALAEGKLQKIWEALAAQLGARKSRSPLRGELVGGTPVVTSTLIFGPAALDARIAVDSDGKISGFRLVPAKQSVPAPAPTPVANERFVETPFAVGEGASALEGTLTLPRGSGPFPAVVMVHGSGPHDRDETVGPNHPFRDLAHALAERGVASLRYEKRTRAHPEAFASGDFTVDEETVDDAARAVSQLRAHAGIDPQRVFLLGHSLGAMMAPRIAERAPDLAGLILLAAPARPLQDIVVEQVRYLADLDGKLDEDEREQIEQFAAQAAAVATLAGSEPAADTLLGLPARYWIDLRGYDPVATARALPQPILVVQGGRDYQVTVDGDFARWHEAFDGIARVQFAFYPALNHLMIAGAGAPGPAEYAVAGQVDTGVVEDITAFVGTAP